MLIKEFLYNGYKVELFEHPIYHDFEFVIKTKDGHVLCTNTHVYHDINEMEKEVKLIINSL